MTQGATPEQGSVLEWALRYTVDQGLCVVPVPHLKKGPVVDNWGKLRLGVEDIPGYFNGHPQNLGVLLGCSQEGMVPIVDVDLDASEAVAVGPDFLPATGAVFGRRSKPRSHYIYRCADPLISAEYKDPLDGAMLVELRGLKKDGTIGRQTIFPPSVRGRDPQKDPPDYKPETIKWYSKGEASTVSSDELVGAVARLAAAALLVKHYPGVGSRHELALALSGGLLRAGWNAEEVRGFVHSVADAAGDDEVTDRITAAATTASKLAAQERVTGWPTVAQIVGDKVVSSVREWLGVIRPEREQAAAKRATGTTEDYFHALADSGYAFALNELDDTIEVNGVRLDDIMRSKILNDVRDRGLRSVEWASDAINALAGRHKFHPVRDYLNDLHWDGKDHIAALAWHLKSGDSEWVEGMLQRWLVGAVGKALEKRQNFMLVLAGPQNIGKSFLARWLNPLGDRYHVEAPIRPDDKDDRLRLIANLTWEVSELGATTRRADVEALKSFVTLRDVTVRKPYGRYDIVKPALASFMGSINHSGSGFLTDTTGNRRFVIVDLLSIDRGYSTRLDAGQVWAQAAALYRAGELPDLSEAEAAKRDAKNEEYMVENAVEAIFHRTYLIDSEAQEWVPSADILQDMEMSGLKIHQNEALKRLAEFLRKEGIEKGRVRISGVQTVAYRGIKRKPGPLT